MALYGNSQLTGKELTFDDDDIIVSKTDLDGKITYGNRLFCKLAGLPEKKCIGAPHNIVRNPNMPRAVFKLLWDTITSKQEIFAYVVNRSANGDHYWVFAHVTPSLDANGAVIGYHSNRRAPNRQVLTTHIEPLYSKLLDIEHNHNSPKAGIEASSQAIKDILDKQRTGFNEFMFSLGV